MQKEEELKEGGGAEGGEGGGAAGGEGGGGPGAAKVPSQGGGARGAQPQTQPVTDINLDHLVTTRAGRTIRPPRRYQV